MVFDLFGSRIDLRGSIDHEGQQKGEEASDVGSECKLLYDLQLLVTSEFEHILRHGIGRTLEHIHLEATLF